MTNQTKKGEKMNAAKAKRVRVSIAKKSGVTGSLQKRAIKNGHWNLSLNDEKDKIPLAILRPSQNQWHLKIMSTLAAMSRLMNNWQELWFRQNCKVERCGISKRRKQRKKIPLNQMFVPLQMIPVILCFFLSKLWNGSKGFRLYGKKSEGPLKSLGVKVHCILLCPTLTHTY